MSDANHHQTSDEVGLDSEEHTNFHHHHNHHHHHPIPVSVVDENETIHGMVNRAFRESESAVELVPPPQSSSSSSSGSGSSCTSGSVESLEGHEAAKDPETAADEKSEVVSSSTVGCCACCGVLRSRCRVAVDNVREFGGEIGDMCTGLNVKQRVRNVFTMETLKSKVPIVKWLPHYRLEQLQGDIVAGLTVGLTVIPQSIAYAQIAGLDSQYGLYSSFIGVFVYAFLGTAKDITLGPVAIMSLLVASFAKSPIPGDATYATIVSLIGGVLQLFMGVFCIGFVIEYISHPVINSFTTASAITIMEGQLKKWFGLKKIPRGFVDELTQTLKHLAQTRLWDFILGMICLLLLHLLKKVKDTKIKNSKTSRLRGAVQYAIWLAGTARNAVVVLLAGAASVIFMTYKMKPFSASNNMPPGLPPFKVPSFSVFSPAENRTIEAPEVFATIGAGFGIIPLLGVLESIAIGKAFAKRNGYRIDADQELIALGVANILGAFVMAYPTTGSFSRTAVNSQSGVRTPLGGLFTGLLVILSLLFLTPYFNYIPDAALAAVIISAVFDLIDFSLLPKLWRVKKVEVIPWLLTFILCLLLGVEYGIIVGIGVSLLMLLYPWSRPSLKVMDSETVTTFDSEQATTRRVVVMTVNQGVLFPGIEHLKDKVAEKDGGVNCVIMDFSHVSNIDYTSVEGFSHMLSEFTKAGSTLVVSNPQPEILRAFENAKMKNFHYTLSIEEGLQLIKEMEAAKNSSNSNSSNETRTDLINGGLLENDDVTEPEVDAERQLEEEEREQRDRSSVV